MSFQDDVRDEVSSVFLDLDEFGEEIDFDGLPVTAVIDDGHGSLKTGSGGGFADAAGLGLAENQITLYLADTLRPRPVPEQRVRINGEAWEVAADEGSVKVEMGMLRLRVGRVYA